MPSSLPPFSSLRAFEATVRLGSLTLAAQELGRTHGAVSRQISALQAHAGVRLFDKVGTGLKANEAGRRLAGAVASAMDSLATTYDAIARSAHTPSLQVACSATFAMRWLVPHMASFSQAHPDIGLRLSMTSAREMRLERDADLVVLWDRSGYAPADQARAIRLGPAAFGVVAAPDYPVQRGVDGLRVACRITHDHTASAWALWGRGGAPALTTQRTIAFPHTHLCIEAAVAGLGVAMVERRLVAAELADGRLTALAGFVDYDDGFAAIPNAQRPLSDSAKLFVDWLAAELA